MNNWYAIRISEQGTRIASKRIIVRGPRNGSHEYRIPDIDDRLSIEAALDDLGISHFVPVGYEDVKHKKRAWEWSIKRYPLLPGYAFVKDVHDWQALEQIPEVIGVLKSGDENLVVPLDDMRMLFYTETIKWLEYKRDREKRMNPRKRRLREMYRTGSRHKINHPLVGEIEITVMSVTGRNTLKAISDKLGKIEVNVDEINEAA